MFIKKVTGEIMNIIYSDILKTIIDNRCKSQREIVRLSGYSLGKVNDSVNYLIENGYLNDGFSTTTKTNILKEKSKPKNAIILAAGYGMRMIPINNEVPKGLLEVHGEPLIERIIKQLHEVNIHNIYIVVGFMKESYEYLIDEYGVKLIYNSLYSKRNNLFSLYCAKEHINMSYIVPCDVWCENNPFSSFEFISWYMMTDELTLESDFKVNKKRGVSYIGSNDKGNKVIGISYIDENDSNTLRGKLEEYVDNEKYYNSFWEECFISDKKFLLPSKIVSSKRVFEINTIENLRELDDNSVSLDSEIINCASSTLNVIPKEIKNISALKKGMTNKSFIFTCNGEKYIFRIPGKGTDQLINRKEEADVYSKISKYRICDDIIYINPENGYKITKFLKNCRTCDANNWDDVKKCITKLRDFHNLKIKVNHTFDLFGLIEYYESLRNCKSVYRDYEKTKQNVLSLKNYINKHKAEFVLTHIDAIPDNFLFSDDEIRLIDWEYAGMQDPHVDLAMFSVYSYYDRDEIDKLINLYFENKCSKETRIKIYCYVAVCGLLWSNWCEYKLSLGVEFGEYSIKQYRYSKDFYKIVKEEIGEINA